MTVASAPLTFRKTAETYALHPFNPLKLLAHSDRIRAMLDGERVFPVSVELDLSLICNHACAWCSFDEFRAKNPISLPTARVLTLIDELVECGVKSVTLTGGGEPLVHKSAVEIMRKLTSSGLSWGLVTNGSRLDGERADAVAAGATFCRVSLDAGLALTHQAIHKTPGGTGDGVRQFDAILANIKRLRSLSETLTIGASFCVFDCNIREILTAARLVKERGGNYLEVRPVYPTAWRGGRQDDAGISDENIDAAKMEISIARKALQDDTFQIIGMIDRFDAVRAFRHRDYYDRCRISALSTVISSDGEIYTCCVHRGLPQFKSGNVLQQPFREAWLGQQRRDVEDSIDIDKCPKCRYVGLNATIQGAFVHNGLHADFI